MRFGRARCAMNPDAEVGSKTGDRAPPPDAWALKNLRLLMRAGVPGEEIETMRRLYEGMRQYADSLNDDQCTDLRDGAELEFESGALRVVHTPGHTPGSCSFVREADRTVIAGDCILKRITPNPVLSPDPIDPSRRFRSLAEYLVSLARVRSFAPTLVLGGHGEPVHDLRSSFIVSSTDASDKRGHEHGTDNGATTGVSRDFSDADEAIVPCRFRSRRALDMRIRGKIAGSKHGPR